eukprot:scaffold87602_cov27-Tisochrysis_lutea.AAC.2
MALPLLPPAMLPSTEAAPPGDDVFLPPSHERKVCVTTARQSGPATKARRPCTSASLIQAPAGLPPAPLPEAQSGWASARGWELELMVSKWHACTPNARPTCCSAASPPGGRVAQAVPKDGWHARGVEAIEGRDEPFLSRAADKEACNGVVAPVVLCKRELVAEGLRHCGQPGGAVAGARRERLRVVDRLYQLFQPLVRLLGRGLPHLRRREEAERESREGRGLSRGDYGEAWLRSEAGGEGGEEAARRETT